MLWGGGARFGLYGEWDNNSHLKELMFYYRRGIMSVGIIMQKKDFFLD